jgi:RNA polymerase sigma-B factor
VLRFFHELSQEHIAKRVGCSQMHVSRLLRWALARMRAQLLEP